MAKDTTRIVEELKLCPDFKTFYNENRDSMVSCTLSQMLDELIEKKSKYYQLYTGNEIGA